MLRVLIADDHAVVRKGMIQILDEANLSFVPTEACNGHEVMEFVREQEFDLLLLDIAMPGKNGVEVLKQIKQEIPKLPVLILSMYPEDQYAVRLIRAGAAGYLNKEAAPDQLAEAVKAISEGRKFISSQVADLLADSLMRGDPIKNETEPHEMLSDREFHVFINMAAGKSQTDIARDLSLSVKTIASYRSRILKKLGMKSNAEMTLYASHNKLI